MSVRFVSIERKRRPVWKSKSRMALQGPPPDATYLPSEDTANSLNSLAPAEAWVPSSSRWKRLTSLWASTSSNSVASKLPVTMYLLSGVNTAQ